MPEMFQQCTKNLRSYAKDASRVSFTSSLGVVGLALQVGVKELVAFGLARVAVRRFQRHKHRVNFVQDLRIVVLKNPALLGLVVGEKDPKAPSVLVGSFFLPPNSVVISSIFQPCIRHVISVEKQRFPFGEEDSAERWPGLPPRVGVKDIEKE